MTPLPALGVFSFPGAAAGDFQSIQTISVGTATSTVSFTSIPSTYKHLQIRAIHRCTQAAGGSDVLIRFNGDTSSSYSYHALQINGASAASFGGSSQTYIRNQSTVDGSYSNVFQSNVIDVLDYASTSKNKTLRAFTGFDANGDGFFRELSGAWYSTSAITQIDFTASGTTFSQYSHFALYGIKG